MQADETLLKVKVSHVPAAEKAAGKKTEPRRYARCFCPVTGSINGIFHSCCPRCAGIGVHDAPEYASRLFPTTTACSPSAET